MYFDVMVIFYERKNSETYTISLPFRTSLFHIPDISMLINTNTAKKVKTLLKNQFKLLLKFTFKYLLIVTI